ncbi:MAG: hypothetical protein GY835_26010 [bacterium]|nr:hypothetical protein [bacterium]
MRKLLLTLCLSLLIAAPAMASMDGGTSSIVAPVSANPGDTVTFEFRIDNGSVDGEFTNVVVLRFPETINISEAWYDDGENVWDFDVEIAGEFSNTAYFRNEVGQMAPGTGGSFYALAHIRPNMSCEEFEIRVKQYGDRSGAPQHWIGNHLDFVLCWLPAAEKTWSSVKSLY